MAEVEALHAFFVDWFSGTEADGVGVFDRRFRRRFDPAFTLIPPAGGALALEELAGAVAGGHGKSPDFRIAIRQVEVVASAGDLVVATYEEWQRNAQNSRPRDNGRAATVVFHRTHRGEPFGLRWRHVHETWLPADVVAAGDFNF